MDAEHIVGELMKGFYRQRPLHQDEKERIGELSAKLQGALPALALTQHTALNTAFMNDVDPEMIYAQQLYGYGQNGDVLLAISTSGNAANVVAAAKLAKKLGIRVIALTGEGGGTLREYADVLLNVPATVTADIQELHLPLYHTLCSMLEEEFFG